MAKSAASIVIPGYQPIHMIVAPSGYVFLYMGMDFVAFSPAQWRTFQDEAAAVQPPVPADETR